jgi:hypothetical protein
VFLLVICLPLPLAATYSSPSTATSAQSEYAEYHKVGIALIVYFNLATLPQKRKPQAVLPPRAFGVLLPSRLLRLGGRGVGGWGAAQSRPNYTH